MILLTLGSRLKRMRGPKEARCAKMMCMVLTAWMHMSKLVSDHKRSDMKSLRDNGA